MSIKDPHDRRTFQHFVQLAEDGTVIAAVEYADGTLQHSDELPVDANVVYVNVTDLHPYDFTDVKLKLPVNKEHPNRKALHAELKKENKGKGKDKDKGPDGG